MSLSYFTKLPGFGRSVNSTSNGHGNSVQPGSNGLASAVAASIRNEPDAAQPVAYEIAHHVNGRLRLRIPRLAYDLAFARRLSKAVRALPVVNQARVSPQSCSLVVHYKRRAFRPGRNGHDEGASVSILKELAKAMQTAADGELERDRTTPKTDVVDKGRIKVLRRMGPSLLGLGLGAGAVAGLALPPLLVGGTILVSAAPIFKRAAQGIREDKRLTADFLSSTGIVLLTVGSGYLMSASLVVIAEGGRILYDLTARHSRQANLYLLLSMERRALVERDGRQEQLALDDVETGDIIWVYPGDQIPVDGIVLDGRAMVDRHRVTGDSVPVVCGEGDLVQAFALVVEGHLRILARQTGYSTHAGRILAEMQAVPETDTRGTNYARKYGDWAVVPTLLTAGAVFANSGSAARAADIAALNMATDMGVAMPLAVLNAQAQAARRGILIRSGQAVEALSQMDTIVFDKTATLTQGRASIVDIRTGPAGISPREVLTLAASAETALDHPIAESIVRFAHDQQLDLRPCTTWDYHGGLGVEAELDGQRLLVGNLRFMRQRGVDLAGLDGPSIEPHLATATRVHVAREGKLMGVICCADPLRPESAEVIAQFQVWGITPLLVSGDGRSVTDSVAAKVNIRPDRVYAEASPQQKLELVRSLQAGGKKVAFVGDGVNDAAAMSQADLSISLGSATDLALENAGVVLTNDDLYDLLAARQIAHHTMQLIRQNRTLATVPVVGGVVYGALTVMNPVAGIAIQNGSLLAGALNSLRPAQAPDRLVRDRANDPAIQ